MSLIIHRTLTFMVLAGLMLFVPWRDLSKAAEIDPSGQTPLVFQCADRIAKWFPPTTIQSQELDLVHVKLDRVKQQLVVIPLK